MRKHILFAVFLVVSIGLNAQNYNMSTGTVNTCSGTFYDSGGNGGTYAANELYTYTICPSTPGAKVVLNFSSFNCEANYDITILLLFMMDPIHLHPHWDPMIIMFP